MYKENCEQNCIRRIAIRIVKKTVDMMRAGRTIKQTLKITSDNSAKQAAGMAAGTFLKMTADRIT